MSPRKSRPVLFELVKRDKGRDGGARQRPKAAGDENGAPAAAPTEAPSPAPRREVVSPPRTPRVTSAQSPAARMMSRLGPTGIAAISVGTILVVLLIVQVWIYLSRDSKNAGGKPSGDNPSNSQIVPSNSGPSGVDSRRSSRDPRADSGNGSRAQLPPFAGNETQRNRPQDNPSANDAGSTTPGGEDRNADSRNRNTVNPPDPPDRARTTPPPPAPDPEPAQWDATLQKGRHYVVVAHYRKVDLPQAQDAAAFLQQRGIQCVIHEIKNAYMVVATQPFLINQKDTAARKAQQARADEFKRKIKALGKEHSRGSGNAFDQCYERLF